MQVAFTRSETLDHLTDEPGHMVAIVRGEVQLTYGALRVAEPQTVRFYSDADSCDPPVGTLDVEAGATIATLADDVDPVAPGSIWRDAAFGFIWSDIVIGG